SLYVIEFGRGSGAGRGSTNTGAGIYRIDYAAEGRRPVAEITVEADSGHAPLEISFSGEGSHSPDGHDITYERDFENDGEVGSTEPNPTHTYTETGTYTARLTVTDSNGAFGVTTLPITVGNTRPEVSFEHPRHGGFAELADTIDYSVNVTDAEDGSTEDGTIQCDRVTVDAQLGHDEHAHPLDNYEGCEGTLYLDPADHGVGQNVFPVLGAAYTDLGGDLELVGQESIQLQVRDKEAEFQHVDTSGTYDGDPLAVGLDLGHVRPPAHGEGGVGDVLLDRADGNRAEAVIQSTGPLAQTVLRTDATTDFRQGVGLVR